MRENALAVHVGKAPAAGANRNGRGLALGGRTRRSDLGARPRVQQPHACIAGHDGMRPVGRDCRLAGGGQRGATGKAAGDTDQSRTVWSAE